MNEPCLNKFTTQSSLAINTCGSEAKTFSIVFLGSIHEQEELGPHAFYKQYYQNRCLSRMVWFQVDSTFFSFINCINLPSNSLQNKYLDLFAYYVLLCSQMCRNSCTFRQISTDNLLKAGITKLVLKFIPTMLSPVPFHNQPCANQSHDKLLDIRRNDNDLTFICLIKPKPPRY